MPLSSFPDLQVVIQALNSSTEFYVAFSGNLLTVAIFFCLLLCLTSLGDMNISLF